MIRLRNVDFERWEPDFSSSGQANPSWTRASLPDRALCNSLEWVEWSENPVQLMICDACGTPLCASGSYVHVSRLDGDHLTWTTPQVDSSDPWTIDHYQPHGVVWRHGAALITRGDWNRWREHAPDVPTFKAFPPANRRALADAWRMAVVGPLRAENLAAVPEILRQNALAAGSMELDQALALIDQLIAWFLEPNPGNLAGTLQATAELPGEVEVIYTDGPAKTDWPVFLTSDDGLYPALDRSTVFVPSTSGEGASLNT